MENIEPIIDFELYLIRHGQSFGNIESGPESNKLCDIHDPLLTKLGEEQAERVGQYLSEIDFDAIYSSALRRAAATASRISVHQKKELPVHIMADLCEIWIPSEYRGMDIESLKEYCPQAVLPRGSDPDAPTIVTDEATEEEMFQRAKRVLDYISSRYHNGEKVAIVAHAGLLTYIIFYIIGYRFYQPGYDFRLSNTGISRLIFFRKGTNKYGDIIFDKVNDTTHLNNFTYNKKEK